MEIKRTVEAKAPLDKVWDLIENPEKAIKDNPQKIELKQKSTDHYELKVPFKMGLLKIKINGDITFIERRPKSYCKLEFKVNIPGGKLDGNVEMTLKPKSATVTIIDLVADVNSSGVASSMLGGEDAMRGRLDGIFDKITSKMGEIAN